MLKNTFLHIPGVGKAKERKLWNAGIQTWEDAMLPGNSKLLGSDEILIKNYLENSFNALDTQNAAFFTQLLPAGDSWRLYREFNLHPNKTRIGYLDIETTGMDRRYYNLTVIGLFDGTNVKYYVQGHNLDDFMEEISSYHMLVTFNGKCFDVPFLRNALPHLDMPVAHIDLRYVFRQLKFTGGLKKIERTTGLARSQDELGLLDGFDAVLLWQLHEKGDRRALTTLLRYNAEDVVGLKPLLEFAYNRLTSEMPFVVEPVPITPRFDLDIPYSVELIRELKSYMAAYHY